MVLLLQSACSSLRRPGVAEGEEAARLFNIIIPIPAETAVTGRTLSIAFFDDTSRKVGVIDIVVATWFLW